MIAVLAGTATLGIAAQAFILLFFWRRAGLTYRPDFRWRSSLVKAPAVAARVFSMILITQLAAIVETRVATGASGDASIGALKYAWLSALRALHRHGVHRDCVFHADEHPRPR